jgi:hypothetical protein
MRLMAICAAALAFSGSAASSQEATTTSASPERTPTVTAWPAPVGHRQPKMSDLPPDVAHREMQPGAPPNEPKQRDLDSRPTICRGLDRAAGPRLASAVA